MNSLRRLLGISVAIFGVFFAACIYESHGEVLDELVPSENLMGQQEIEEFLSNATNTVRSKRNAANNNSVEGT